MWFPSILSEAPSGRDPVTCIQKGLRPKKDAGRKGRYTADHVMEQTNEALQGGLLGRERLGIEFQFCYLLPGTI